MAALAPHVLVARLDNVGDVILAGPAVRAVASGARRVTMLCSSTGHPAAELLPGVDAVEVFDAPWVAFDAPPVDRSSTDALVDRLAGLDVDEALILTSFHQSPLPLALLLRMAGVATIAATSVDFPGRLLDVRHTTEDGHEVERSLALAEALGHRLPPGDDGRLRLRGPLPPAPLPGGGPWVVVHPGASVPARAWDPGLAADLVELLHAEGWAVAVTGGPKERRLTARVAGRHGIDLGGASSLPELAAVLAAADVVVAGNTGPAHVAAAVDTPVVSIFPPVVDVRRWRPWGVRSIVLGDQRIACAGCRARECPVPGRPCLGDVTPAAVAAAVGRLAPVAAA